MMIYVTVGSFRPFPRLIRKMDEITPLLRDEVVMQIGKDTFKPKNAQFAEFWAHSEHMDNIRRAAVVVTHAADGIMQELGQLEKRAVFVPRRRKYGEIANDHQLELAEGLERRGAVVKLVYDVNDLESILSGNLEDIPVPKVAIDTRLVKRLRETIIELSGR